MSIEKLVKDFREKHPDLTEDEIMKAFGIEAEEPSGLLQKMSAVVDEAMASKLNEFEATLEEKLDKIIKDTESRFVDTFAETLGLNKSVPITRDETVSLIRETLMKLNPDGHRKADDEEEKEEDDVNKGGGEDDWDPAKELEKQLAKGVL